MDLPRPGLLAAAAAAALSFEGSSSDDAAWRAPSGENAVSKKGLLGPEGFALWTRAAIVLKGESWERAPGVLLGERSPLDFFAAGLVGGLVGQLHQSCYYCRIKRCAGLGGVAVRRGLRRGLAWRRVLGAVLGGSSGLGRSTFLRRLNLAYFWGRGAGLALGRGLPFYGAVPAILALRRVKVRCSSTEPT